MSKAKENVCRFIRQFRAIFRIYLLDGLAYKASGVIWILTDVASAVTMPLVWLAASHAGSLAGFTGTDLVVYYLFLLLISNFVLCHFMWDLGFEIREGLFSTSLLRPVSILRFTMIRNFAWRCIRLGLFLPWFVVIFWAYSTSISHVQLHLTLQFWISLALGHILSVVFVTAMAMLALLTTEAQAIFELYYLPMLFLSGQLFPIDLLPNWARGLAKALPFYYTTGAPTEILVGRTDTSSSWSVIGAQLIWIFLAYGLFKLLFSFGIKRYSGAGM